MVVVRDEWDGVMGDSGHSNGVDVGDEVGEEGGVEGGEHSKGGEGIMGDSVHSKGVGEHTGGMEGG